MRAPATRAAMTLLLLMRTVASAPRATLGAGLMVLPGCVARDPQDER
jgi:hypothetical protein